MEIKAAKSTKANKWKGKISGASARYPNNKKTAANTSGMKNCGTRSISFGSKKLLLLAKAFIKVSCNSKHCTDKKASQFGEEISVHFEEIVVATKKFNESHPEFTPIKSSDWVSLQLLAAMSPAINPEVCWNCVPKYTELWGNQGGLGYGSGEVIWRPETSYDEMPSFRISSVWCPNGPYFLAHMPNFLVHISYFKF
jgi:hypothetical protein